MRFTRSTILIGAGALLVAGTAAAAAEKLHTMEVALPDGSTAHIEYAGEVAPKVTIEPVEQQARAAYDPFTELDRIAYEMRARQQAMLQQMAAMQQAAAESGARAAGAPGMTFVGSLPAGAQVSYYSSTTDANGCTQTVQYSSDGSSEEPKVTRASAGNCDAASASDAAPTPAAAPAPAPEPRKLDDNDV
jgi:hypothetical protein